MKKSIAFFAISMSLFAGSALAERSREINVSNDSATKTHTREVSGTTATGKSYSVTSSTQKIEDGRVHSVSATGPNGNAAGGSTTVTHSK